MSDIIIEKLNPSDISKDVRVDGGKWKPNEETVAQVTGVLGVWKVFDKSDLVPSTVYTIHVDGKIDINYFDTATGIKVQTFDGQQQDNLRRIGGVVENDPETGKPVLKYKEVSSLNIK